MDKTHVTPEGDQLPICPDELAFKIPKGLAGIIQGALKETPLNLLPYEQTCFDQLEESLQYLKEHTQFDFSDFNQTINGLIQQNAQQTFVTEKTRAIQAAHRGKVLIVEEETSELANKPIPPAVRPKFVQAITDTTFDEDSFPLKQETPSEFTEEEIELLYRNIGDEIVQKTLELIKVTPTLELLKSGSLDGLQLLVNPRASAGIHEAILHSAPNNRTVATVRKKIIKLKNLIDDFAQNPAQFAAERVYSNNFETISEETLQYIEGILLETTTTIYNSLSPEELKQAKHHSTIEDAPKPSKREKRRQKQLAQHALSNNVSIDPECNLTIEPDREITDVSISLPWVEGGSSFQSNVTEIKANNQSIYLINGMEEKLQTIANTTLDKEELALKITGAINNQVRLLLAGYLPWDRQTSTVRSVAKNGKAPQEYKDEAIWYTYDLRPNAPRVYFVIKNASEIEKSKQAVLHPDTKCMIIVAITDKSQQLNVLKRFTGKNRSSLVAQGAGSI